MKSRYGAGLVSQSFWFVEFKKFIRLIVQNKTKDELKDICINNNYFGAQSDHRAMMIFNYLWNRSQFMDEGLINIFLNTDLGTQKIINLITILKTDRLFFEFMYDVYREKLILGSRNINLSDISIFFKNKSAQIEEVARIKDNTKRRLASTYINFLTDANLITYANKEKYIKLPIFDIVLENYLKNNGDEAIVKALEGVL